jgi:hypothetical protein
MSNGRERTILRYSGCENSCQRRPPFLLTLSRRCELARKTPTADYGGDAMTEIRLASLQGGAITFGSDAIAAFRQTLRGNVCLAEEPGYDEARTI